MWRLVDGAQVETRRGIRFRRAGSPNGPPALFLPGAGWTGAEGLAVARALPQFAWHCLDLPGTGGSLPLAKADQRSIATWLDRFCSDVVHGPVHLAGHSLGGFLALAAAAAATVPLRSLMLIDSGVGPLAVPQELGAIAYLVPALARLDAWTGGVLIAGRPGRPAPPEPPEDPTELGRRFALPQSEELQIAALDRPGPGEAWNLDGRAVQRLGLVAAGLRQRPALAALTVPTLELLALHPRGPAWTQKIVAQRRRLLRALPWVQVAELSTGHYPFWEDPAAFKQAVQEFYEASAR